MQKLVRTVISVVDAMAIENSALRLGLQDER